MWCRDKGRDERRAPAKGGSEAQRIRRAAEIAQRMRARVQSGEIGISVQIEFVQP